MRRIIFAPSFDAELLALSISIEARFGARAADDFETRIKHTAESVAHLPTMGGRRHGYPTALFAIVQYPNWIFYRFTEDAVHFLHIRDGRMDKGPQSFGGN